MYAALFRREGDALARLTPDLALPPEALIDRLPEGEILFCGDGLKSYGPMFLDRLGGRASIVEGPAGLPSAGAVGILGERIFLERRRRRPAFGGARVHPAFRGGIQAPRLLREARNPFAMSGCCNTAGSIWYAVVLSFFPRRRC